MKSVEFIIGIVISFAVGLFLFWIYYVVNYYPGTPSPLRYHEPAYCISELNVFF